MESKEHKPGPIGKERSLKNRIAKDVQQAEAEGKEDPADAAAVGSPEDAETPEADVVAELGTEVKTMISVPATEFEENPKVMSMLKMTIKQKNGLVSDIELS